MLIPVLDYAKSKEENKLIIHGVEIEDPLSSAHEYVNDFNASPPFGLFDIFNHLIYSSTEHDKQLNKGLPHTKHLMTIVFLKRDMLNLY